MLRMTVVRDAPWTVQDHGALTGSIASRLTSASLDNGSRAPGADPLFFMHVGQGQLGCDRNQIEDGVPGTRRHAQCMDLLPCADADAGYVWFQSLLSNIHASSLYTRFLVELESPAKVYQQLVTVAKVMRARHRE
jgi:hypothetical protein